MANAHTAGHAPRADSNIKKLDQPVIKEDATDQDWIAFKWGRYCMAVGINNKEDQLRGELLYCCNMALQVRLLEMKDESKASMPGQCISEYCNQEV